MQDLTYGGNPSIPGIGGGLDGVPDIAYFNTVNPTNTSQMQFNGRVDANITQKDRLTFTLYYVPATTTDYNGPVRAENLWHHSQTNNAYALIWNHIFSSSAPQRSPRQRRRMAVERSRQQRTGALRLARNFDRFHRKLRRGDSRHHSSTSDLLGPSVLNQWTYSYC